MEHYLSNDAVEKLMSIESEFSEILNNLALLKAVRRTCKIPSESPLPDVVHVAPTIEVEDVEEAANALLMAARQHHHHIKAYAERLKKS